MWADWETPAPFDGSALPKREAAKHGTKEPNTLRTRKPARPTQLLAAQLFVQNRALTPDTVAETSAPQLLAVATETQWPGFHLEQAS